MRTWQSALYPAILAVGFGIAATPLLAQAQQKFPTKPVRIVVGFSPGSATDITARLIAPKLSDMWGQPVVIENRSGAGGQLATVHGREGDARWPHAPDDFDRHGDQRGAA